MKKSYIFAVFLIFIILNSILLEGGNSNPSKHSNKSLTPSQSNDLVAHEKIQIEGNNGFNEFPGTGTESDPYIISNLEIISPVSEDYDLIAIADTDVHFVIENNYMSGEDHNTGFGITFNNVENGLIRNNTITKTTHGPIAITNSSNNTIEVNLITDNGGHGIELLESNNNIIRHNTINSNGGDGIASYFSKDNSITNNSLSLNGLNGIRIETSNSHLISGNTITLNVEGGIYLGSALSNIVESNQISDNPVGIAFHQEGSFPPSSMNIIVNNIITDNDQGILIDQGNGNIISNNLIDRNEFDGVVVDNADNNNVTENIILQNGHGFISTGLSSNNLVKCNLFEDNANYGASINFNSEFDLISENDFVNNQFTPQAVDNGKSNLFEKNYWSDLGDLDNNGDGINDIEYMIEGSGGNVDNTSSPFRNSEPNGNISICKVGLLVIFDNIVSPLPTTIIPDGLLQPTLVLPFAEPILFIFFLASSITVILSIFYLRLSKVSDVE